MEGVRKVEAVEMGGNKIQWRQLLMLRSKNHKAGNKGQVSER